MIEAWEAIANATIGLAVSWGLTWFWLGFSPAQSAGITAVFFCVSTARSFFIRHAFKRYAKASE